ncbi:RING-H2 finger protein ATL74 [Hibiscus syriacus]|uniref:RING-H2 finger protein ATL74 n=1 Tax=Hibiscus syriacus TaxID=106335 RepID=A0A6A3ACB6_HIBSY|nr:E3 ubiquitin-protein ligase RING1-like [Hibiscus syriacus]KAE8702140.1 RING-H2 finger protein ATL74 [Hibiscus syriacus]
MLPSSPSMPPRGFHLSMIPGIVLILSMLLVVMVVVYLRICEGMRHHVRRGTNGDINHDIERRFLSQPFQQQPDETSRSMTIRYENGERRCTDCAICLEEFKDGDSCKALSKCKHLYHRSCIDQWLLQHRSCPLCRGSGHGFRPAPNSTTN